MERTILNESLNTAKVNWAKLQRLFIYKYLNTFGVTAEEFDKLSEEEIQRHLRKTSEEFVFDFSWGGFKDYAEGDPSPKKKYLAWMIFQVIEESWIAVATLLPVMIKRFDYAVNNHLFSGKAADINSYPSFRELNAATDKAIKDAEIRRSQKIISKMKVRITPEERKVEDDVELIASTNIYYIIRPLTVDASVRYGKNTKWCISQHDNRHFEDYTIGDGKNIYFLFVTDPEVLGKIAKINGANGTASMERWQRVAITVESDGVALHKHFWDRYDIKHELTSPKITVLLGILQINSDIFESLSDEQYEEYKELKRKNEARYN